MSKKKTKPRIGRPEPYTCANHSRRLAIAKKKGVDLCWECLLEPCQLRDWWIKRYEELKQ